MTATGTATGTVVFFDRFGFIKPDNGGRDIFVHRNGLSGIETLQRDQRISFDLGEGRDGRPCAVNVRLLAA